MTTTARKHQLLSTRNISMLDETINQEVGCPTVVVTFKDVHKAEEKLGRRGWEQYPKEASGESREGRSKVWRGFRPQANYYTREEDQKILGYILEGHYSRNVKGRALWSMMEKAGLLPGRTWQSMRERFMKSILRRLHSFSCIGEEGREQLKSAAAPGKKRNQSAKKQQSEERNKTLKNNVTAVFSFQAVSSKYQQSLKVNSSGRKKKDHAQDCGNKDYEEGSVKWNQELENIDNQLTEKKEVSKDLPVDSSLGKTDGEYYEEDCGKLEPGLEEMDVEAEMKSEIEEHHENCIGNENRDELDNITMEARRQVLGLRKVLGVKEELAVRIKLVVGKELGVIKDMAAMKEQIIKKKEIPKKELAVMKELAVTKGLAVRKELAVRKKMAVRKELAGRQELVKTVQQKQLVVLQDHYEVSGRQDQLAFMEKLGLCSHSEAAVKREELEEAREKGRARTTRSQTKIREDILVKYIRSCTSQCQY